MGFLIWQLVVQEKKVPINSANIKPHNPSHSSRCAVPVPKKIPPNSQRKEIRVANESMRHTLGEQAVVLYMLKCGLILKDWKVCRRPTKAARHFSQFASYWNQS